MLTDKHIMQWAGYLIDEFNCYPLEILVCENRGIEKILDEVFVAMYKKGYEDCQEEMNSERQQIYRDGFFAGQSQVIERMTNAGILPSVDFNLERVYRSDDNE